MGKRRIQIEDLLRIVRVGDPQIHPTDPVVLYTRTHVEDKFKVCTHIWSVDGDGKTSAWTTGDSKNWSPRWSPLGTGFCFISNRSGKLSQLFWISRSGGEAQQLTSLPEGSFEQIRWSPDGTKIAFTFRATPADFTQKAAKSREEEGRALPPKVIENAWYRLDGEGFYLGERHKLYVIELESRELKVAYEGCPVARYDFDWSPNSDRLVLSRSFAEEPWIDPIDDGLVIVNLDGSSQRIPNLPAGVKRLCRWSPDGEKIVWMGSEDIHDHREVQNLSMYIGAPDGYGCRKLTNEDIDFHTSTLNDSADYSFEWMEWHPDGSRILTCVGERGQSQLASVDVNSGEVRRVTQGDHVIGFGSVSKMGAVACNISEPIQPAAIGWIGANGELKRLTDENQTFRSEISLQIPKEFETVAEDGYPVHGWVMEPESGAFNRPGVVEVHGGPQCQYGWCFFFEFQLLAAEGYTVVYVNPRGSKGYGSPHCAAIAGKWGDKDWLDIKAATDYLKSLPHVDENRVGIMGGSYGGYMVNWAVGHSEGYKAAITDRCVSNLISKSLNTDYPYHPGTHWKGAAYEEWEGIQELWRDSPIAYFHRVNTPMLIIHSEGDLRCHIEQGEQVFTALCERKIPARFVRYPVSTSHGMSRGGPPDLRMHRLTEIVNWWRKWLA